MKKAKSAFPKAIDSQRSRLKAEAKRFDVKHFRPGQLEIMEAVLAGKSVLGIMPTGSGKSLTFQLPALLLPKATIVVSPLISLMQDQVAKAEQANVEAEKLDFTLTATEDRETRDAVAEGEHRLIYVTPERLDNPEYLALLRSGGVSLLVIDEAHCISQWRPLSPLLFVPAASRSKARESARLALTATATPGVQQDINRQLGLQDPVVIDTGIERPNLFLEVFRTVNGIAKRERIRLIVDETEGTGIVYVATVRTANELYEWLCNSGVNAARYHAKMKTRERESTQQDFMAGAFKLIVATKAFGLGIDKPDIRFIIHYNFPDSLRKLLPGNRARPRT